MSLRKLCLFAVVLFSVYPLHAATYYVGTCHANSFATISDAVNSSTVTPGSTVKICGGQYFEQVIISKPLTLEGVLGSDANGQVLIAGNGAMQTTVSPISNTLLTPIVWVTAGPVTLQDISVDDDFLSCANAEYAGIYYASGTQISPNVPFGSNLGNGIYLYEVGGTVSNNSILGPKQQGGVNLKGVGIWDEAAGVTVSSNTIMFIGYDHQPFNFYCIAVAEDNVTIKANKISGVLYGIDMGCHPGTVTANTINLSASGLLSVPVRSRARIRSSTALLQHPKATAQRTSSAAAIEIAQNQ
jgi:nitrous oxidase accessory protein NosD